MPIFPDETDLLSLFECEPTLFDKSKDFPFYYNEANYKFTNGVEEFSVTISPSYGEVRIEVKELDSHNLMMQLDLKRVEKYEITADRRDCSSILMTRQEEDLLQTVEVVFKPRFKVIFKDHLTE
ncbi:hypothetical protein [Mesobacillus subterraneus]|uniref:Uncharacterized protein n=1 Tax=Mesobacillus subterraneus TaxID=285983 RepID=A0A427TWE8_9BACI|nr:hypothetical protein [Mesobacillus subterraneus]RSD28724.1 hypothetical protein EJA10_03880 [Mesobacillus subterraneus]